MRPTPTRWKASITFICESSPPRAPPRSLGGKTSILPSFFYFYTLLKNLITPGHLKLQRVRARTGLNPPHRGQPFPSCSNQHRVQRTFGWINELLISSLTLKNVYTCSLARLISPMGSLWIYCKRFLRFLPDPDRLCCSPFWKSITASRILASARHVARRATEARSAE